ncbi:hypothetical protein NDN08_005033 [Rhodosorus marinus]|uniref:indole-3-glycerol-phosphate synthase n=1 Tax=Rhodosorus marinus TaxID=101924 RepID=A0AAV8V1E6_9RHOD|nr:hypothetical protein NDN08_005033 [Rhodosorus marinus]
MNVLGFVSSVGQFRGRRRAVCRESKEWKPEGLLYGLVERKFDEIEKLEKILKERPDHPLALRTNFAEADATEGSLYRALRRADGRLGIVAELKKRHPVHPGEEPLRVLDYDQDLVKIVAKTTAEWGCDATMIWTDGEQYEGDLNHLAAAGSQLKLPLVRGDFIVHPLQIAEASLCGAKAVLIIAGACLPDLESLLNSATLMGLESIVEVHTDIELAFAVEAGAAIILVSNLNRATNQEEPMTAERLRPSIPDFIITAAGGGYSSAGECYDLLDMGFDAVVLGRTLFNTRHGEQLVKEIQSRRADLSTNFFRGFGLDPDADAKPFETVSTEEDLPEFDVEDDPSGAESLQPDLPNLDGDKKV